MSSVCSVERKYSYLRRGTSHIIHRFISKRWLNLHRIGVVRVVYPNGSLSNFQFYDRRNLERVLRYCDNHCIRVLRVQLLNSH